MRISILALTLAGVSVGLARPAAAAIAGFSPNADFGTSGSYTVGLFDGSTYTFTPIPLDGNDGKYRTAALATTGNATGYGGGFIGGEDFTSYSAGSATPGNNFGGDFITAPTARPIDYSLTDTFVALRFGSGSNIYYGYAEVAGQTLVSFAYNDQAGGSITTGDAIQTTVPEPATALVGLIGAGMLASFRRSARVAV